MVLTWILKQQKQYETVCLQIQNPKIQWFIIMCPIKKSFFGVYHGIPSIFRHPDGLEKHQAPMDTLLTPDHFLWKLPICGDSQAAIQLQIVQGHILGLSAKSEVYISCIYIYICIPSGYLT